MVSVLSLTYALPDHLGELCGLLWRIHLTVLAEVIRSAHCGQNQSLTEMLEREPSSNQSSLCFLTVDWIWLADSSSHCLDSHTMINPPLDPKARISLSPLSCFCQCFYHANMKKPTHIHLTLKILNSFNFILLFRIHSSHFK